MAISGKDVTGVLKELLKHGVLRYSLAAVMVVAAIFGGLYVLRDTPVVEAFKRDDRRLDGILQAITALQKDIDEHGRRRQLYNIAMNAQLDSIQSGLLGMEKKLITVIVFSPNIPADIRADAFDRARALKMNHGIRQQYRDFVLQYPEAAWQVHKPSYTLDVHTPTGARGDE